MHHEQEREGEVVELADEIYAVSERDASRLTGGGVNTYILGQKSPLLIDAGLRPSVYLPLLETALQRYDLGPITKILLTHGHPDHIGGCDHLQKRFPSLKIYKMPLPTGRQEKFSTPYLALEDGAEIQGEGFTLQSVHTPGHAIDHLAYYLPERKILFSGDVVIGSGTVVVPPAGGGLRIYLQSLERLLTMDIALIYPGHGPIITNPQEKIHEYIERRKLREAQVLEALSHGDTTVSAIVARIYTDVPKRLHRTAEHSVLSHLFKLEEEGRVVSRTEAGEKHFYLQK